MMPHPLVRFKACPIGKRAPFGQDIEFTLYEGSCIELRGSSGRGKTTLATVLTGINKNTRYERSLLNKLQLDVECEWSSTIPIRERCGVLFQQTTLLDDLTVAGNLAVALKLHKDIFPTTQVRDLRIKQLLDMVGLNYGTDAHKLPSELSGGMGRRVCLALQLAQKKSVIVLDEPFTGLDYESAVSIAKELVRLRRTQNTALILISHEPYLSKLVMAEEDDDNDDGNNWNKYNRVIELKASKNSTTDQSKRIQKPSLFGISFFDRFLERLIDYTFYSLPLIAMAFVACGLAISMLSADLLQRLDISTKVLDLVDKEVRPLIKLLTGEEANTIQMMGIRFKVNSMLNRTVPPAKATLYAIGLAKLFVLEIGPLLTALLLCGRIGGSYAGKVGTMQATDQNKLLRTLGVNPQWWTLWPSVLAASLASPILTVIGTSVALLLGGWVATYNGIVGNTHTNYWMDLKETIFPILRLRSFEGCWNSIDIVGDEEESVVERSNNDLITIMSSMISVVTNAIIDPNNINALDVRVTYKTSSTRYWWIDTLIEVTTYPPVYHLLKAEVFILIIIGVAEWIARSKSNLTPRGIPSVITVSVVIAGLSVIFSDWAFSQLWLLRE